MSISPVRRLALTASSLLFAAVAGAAERPFAAPQTAEQMPASGAGSLVQVTLSLLIVLGAVFAAAWVVRRMRTMSSAAPGAVQIIADVPLGTKERAVLVQVGHQQVLLGVAPGRVSALHVLAEPVQVNRGDGLEPTAASRPDFKSILRRSLGL